MQLNSWSIVLAVTHTSALHIPQPQQVLDHRIPSIPSAAPAQQVVVAAAAPSTIANRKLTGRFLHITDIHPDPYYKVHSSTDETGACHRGKGVAGYYGAETSDCDTPLTLVNATFDWIKKHIREEVDFVIWTGDSARHDNDEKVPRSRVQVLEQNKLIERKFREAFGRDDDDDEDPTNDFVVPIVPTLGNNDILPHNIFEKGPNLWTSKYLDIWRSMIPEHERHIFARGGWFSVEVIKNKMAIFSLNTLYFFTSNGAVDGCAVKKQPGHEQFEWLRIQLDILRSRGMKAILIGHVPPARVDTKVSWDETCWQKYTLWSYQYRDIIIAGLYGHMNIDHFMLQDAKAVKKHVRKGYEYANEDALTEIKDVDTDPSFSTSSAQDYLQSLRSAFARIPAPKADSEADEDIWDDFDLDAKKPKKGKKKKGDIGGEFAERYSLTFVSPSLVPNYFPSIRIFTYNISGLEALEVPGHSRRTPSFELPHLSQQSADSEDIDPIEDSTEDDEDAQFDEHHFELRSLSSHDEVSIDKKKKKKKSPKRFKFTVPKGPSKTSSPGPAYSPQPLTFISYKQYYANLTYLNNDFTHDNEEEWPPRDNSTSTNNNNTLVSDDVDDWAVDEDGTPLPQRWKPGKHHDKKPKHVHPDPLPFSFHVEYDTSKSNDAFGLTDLTTRNFVNLAQRIAGGGKHKKHKKKKKKHKKKHSSHKSDESSGHESAEVQGEQVKPSKKKDKVWNTFLRRAFVGALEAVDLAALLDHGDEHEHEYE